MAALGYDVVSFSEACMDVNHVVYRIRCTELRVDRGIRDIIYVLTCPHGQRARLRSTYHRWLVWLETSQLAYGSHTGPADVGTGQIPWQQDRH